MVFVALPSSLPSQLEEWYVTQVLDMTQNRETDGGLPRKFRNQPPAEDLQVLDEFLEENGKKTGLQLQVQKPRKGGRPLRQQELNWFVPVVLNNVVKTGAEWDTQTALGGYSICFDNTDAEEQVHVVFEVLLASKEPEKDPAVLDSKDLKHKHLTPLEEQIKISIAASKAILNEMTYMEKREARMRRTADSINRNVRYFSYLSILILLSVTFVQVRYLKRYFRKKKIM